MKGSEGLNGQSERKWKPKKAKMKGKTSPKNQNERKFQGNENPKGQNEKKIKAQKTKNERK